MLCRDLAREVNDGTSETELHRQLAIASCGLLQLGSSCECGSGMFALMDVHARLAAETSDSGPKELETGSKNRLVGSRAYVWPSTARFVFSYSRSRKVSCARGYAIPIPTDETRLSLGR